MPQSKEDPRLRVENLCLRTTEASLLAAFEKKAVRVGDITKLLIVADPDGQPPGYGWVYFKDYIATMAGLVMDGEIVDGCKIRVLNPNMNSPRYADLSKTICPASAGKEYTLF